MISESDWRTTYANKIATADEAIATIRSGRRILIGSGAAEPVSLVHALVGRAEALTDVEIVHLLTLGPAPYVDARYAAHFRHKAFFIGANVREAVREGRADFIPVFLSEIPSLIRSRRLGIDVALIQTSPPDAHGYVSLGVSVDVVRAAVDTAELVLAEVHPDMPRTYGDSFLHVSKIDRLVPVDTPLLELAAEAPGAIEAAIGRHVASLVPDGATIQTGIGSIPDAVLDALVGHRDLGIHTEMFSDGVMRLAKAGVVNGARKSLLRGKIVTSFIMGSRELYAWAHENPALELRGSEFTNSVSVIAQNDAMISVNSALAVDLTGQVAADTLQGRFFSGIGGQVDFVRGSSASRGGKSIIALRSTAKNGTVSRIRATLEEGAGVVTSRGDVRYVVTEHGVADLWGKSVRERADALIAIADPAFREELTAKARERVYLVPELALPRSAHALTESRTEPLRGGGAIVVRPIRSADHAERQRLLEGIGDEDVRGRFASSPSNAVELAACDPESGELLGLGGYDVDPATALARAAFAVKEDRRGLGLATSLLRRLGEVAQSRGLAGFTARVPASNESMLVVFQRSGLVVTTIFDGLEYRIEARFKSS